MSDFSHKPKRTTQASQRLTWKHKALAIIAAVAVGLPVSLTVLSSMAREQAIDILLLCVIICSGLYIAFKAAEYTLAQLTGADTVASDEARIVYDYDYDDATDLIDIDLQY